MSAPRRDPAQAMESLTMRQVEPLLNTYREALDELRTWHDPGVAALIVRLESLQLLAVGQLRYLREGSPAASEF
jgi:hypothetical protein